MEPAQLPGSSADRDGRLLVLPTDRHSCGPSLHSAGLGAAAKTQPFRGADGCSLPSRTQLSAWSWKRTSSA